MKIQLVNTFFYLLLPFSRFLDPLPPLPLVLPFVSVHQLCGSRVLSHPFYTPQHISRSIFVICRAMLSRFNSFDWLVVIYLQFYDRCKPQRISSLTYCPIFVRLGGFVFDFYDRSLMVEYR